MLKVAGVGVVGAIAVGAEGESAARHGDVAMWEVFEVSLQGAMVGTGNPFDVPVGAEFRQGARVVTVYGFYDGAQVYKLRFMPDAIGEWTYTTVSTDARMHGRVGSFRCVAAKAGAHGPVRVANGHHFAHADGTKYCPFGTTCYAWVHQSEQVQRETLEALKGGAFNKIRMCVFPKSYEYNHNEPPFYPFERDAAGVHDFSRPVPAFYKHLEDRIKDLAAIGVQADLILFHPYDRWGYSSMAPEVDERYLRYVVARLSSFANVWWSMANEFDLMKAKKVEDFDRYFHIVERQDAVGHLRSIHYSKVMYDNTRPSVTHASMQTAAFEKAEGWLKEWKKPICFDEVMYEGNMNRRWGNLSGEEMTRRFWLGVIAGCYVTHGETYIDAASEMDENLTPVIPWSHGGPLHGTSPARIKFLREVVETTAKGGVGGLEAAENGYYLNAMVKDAAGKVVGILYYFDFHQPVWYEFPLPAGRFKAEVIDPWAMTLTAVDGEFAGKTKMRLPGKAYGAVRFLSA